MGYSPLYIPHFTGNTAYTLSGFKTCSVRARQCKLLKGEKTLKKTAGLAV